MLNNKPTEDLWHLQDNDSESQHYGRIFHFDFAFIHSEEMKSVVKDYVWQNYRTGNITVMCIYHYVSYLRYFMSFAEQQGLYSFKDLDNAKVDLFRSYLRTIVSFHKKKPLSYGSQRHCFVALKAVVSWCYIHRPADVPKFEIFGRNEFSGINRRLKIEFIPDEVVAQINVALKTEENPYIKYGVIILESTGMRLGDLLNLDIDCVKPHLVSGYTISWFDHKNRRQRPPMPIRAECAQAVDNLLAITDPLRSYADTNVKDKLFIYKCTSVDPKYAGKVVVPSQFAFCRWLKAFVKNHCIIDANGELYEITTHQFRRTLGTDMLSKGVDLGVIQQVLGHTDPFVTQRFYADVKDKERAEAFKKIGIIGNINLLDKTFFQDDTELEWFKANKNTGACLCDGYCTKPFVNGEVCDRLLRRQKCYTCSRYITTPEYLDAHRKHLEGLERQIAEGAIYGEHYAEHFIPTIEVLKFIIESLERLQNDRNESGFKT